MSGAEFFSPVFAAIGAKNPLYAECSRAVAIASRYRGWAARLVLSALSASRVASP
jgi:hypothetical protein